MIQYVVEHSAVCCKKQQNIEVRGDFIMNEMNFEIVSGVYSIMRSFTEFRVVFNDRAVYCVGGCRFDNNELTISRDFFKKEVIFPFPDSNDNSPVKDYVWHKEESCIELKRQDDSIKIYCLRPRVEGYFDVDHAVYDEKSFCNDYIADEDSREINGIYYNVVNPARTKTSRIDSDIAGDMNKLFHADDYLDITLKLFYVKDFEKRVFYMGLWDAEKQCPISCDPSAPSNSDYSEEYALFFPN